MKIAVLGGGPAGLYFAISMKLRDSAHDVTVYERNRADDTFGWGVVLSDETLDNLAANDPVSADRIRQHFAYWDDIAVVYNGTRTVSTGHGFCGIGRMRLLLLLQERARELGVKLEFQTEIDDPRPFMESHDMVLAADGLNSRTRGVFEEVFKPDIDVRKCKFVWLGTRQKFDDAFTFIFEKTEYGWVWAHAYQFDADTATFIIECSQETWDKFGFGAMSKEESIATCERIFADHLDGHSLISNANHIRGSAWINFPRVLCERWSHENLALMGDAAASAHFSIGSGTKLALESAIALAGYVHSEPGLAAAFEKYEDARRTEVLKLQSAARNSLEWFEDVERYLHLDPVQFNYSLLTRSQRISHENLRLRDGAWLAGAETWFQAQAGAAANTNRPPMFAPYRLRGMELKNRVVVSPMAQYRAVDGMPTDWHFVHYCERAKGGAGLVYIEMTCVSPEGRITPGCPGFYRPEHEAAWKRLNRLSCTPRRTQICAQLGHSGPRIDPARLGGRQCPARRGQLAAARRLRRALGRGEPGAESHGPRRHGHGARPVRRSRRNGGALRLRHARTPHGAWLSSVVLHFPADQPARGRVWRQPGQQDALSAGSVPRGARRVATRQADLGPHLGDDWVGDEGVTHRRQSRSPACSMRQASISATCRRARPRSAPSRSMAAYSRRRFRTGSERDRHGNDGRRKHLRARPRQFDPDGRPGRPRLPGAAASGRSLLDIACCRRAR